eukprot:2670436-Prymnesium_polylepis.1
MRLPLAAAAIDGVLCVRLDAQGLPVGEAHREPLHVGGAVRGEVVLLRRVGGQIIQLRRAQLAAGAPEARHDQLELADDHRRLRAIDDALHALCVRAARGDVDRQLVARRGGATLPQCRHNVEPVERQVALRVAARQADEGGQPVGRVQEAVVPRAAHRVVERRPPDERGRAHAALEDPVLPTRVRVVGAATAAVGGRARARGRPSGA